MAVETKYFAAKTGEDFLAEFFKRVDTCKEQTTRSPYFRLILKKRRMWYGQAGSATSFGLQVAGERGQLVAIHSNEFRTVGTHVLGLLGTDPVSFNVEALNDDAASHNQAILVQQFLESLVESKDLAKIDSESNERAFLDGEAFLHIYWNPFVGMKLQEDPETGETFFEGDIVFELFGPDRIIRDTLAPPDNQQWLGVISQVNKYDLAAQYPQYAEEILACKGEPRMFGTFGNIAPNFFAGQAAQADDFINLYTFYHEKTPATPNGKYCLAVNKQIYLVEGDLEYSRIPIVRHSAANVLDSVFGYTPCNDALVHNEILNAAKSIELSNALNHGTRTILVQAGNKFLPQSIANGNKLLEYNTTAPSVMEFPSTPDQVISMGERASQSLSNTFAQNAVSMGRIEASTRLSFSSMSMAEGKAMEGIQTLFASRNRFWVEVGHLIVEIFKLKAKAPRIMRMVGESGAYLMEEFSGEKLGDIDRIKITVGNSLVQTPNQRRDVADMLLQYGLITDPGDLTEYLLNGHIDRPLKTKMLKALRIKEHCEMLSRGELPEVLVTDDHVLFIQHAIGTVLSKETSVNNPQVVDVCAQYIQKHEEMAMLLPPQKAALYAHTPLPIIAPAGTPPGSEMNGPVDVPPGGPPQEPPPGEQQQPPV